MQVLRIFVSSPSDVTPEREHTAQVILRLQGEFAAHLKLEPYFWEHEPMLSNRGDYQDNIPSPGDFDVFICLLWSRMGSRLSARHRTAAGETFASGTQHEFYHALRAAELSRSEQRPHGTPDILLFVKKQPPKIDPNPREERMERYRQYDELRDFLAKAQLDETDGTFMVAMNSFDDLVDFEQKLEKGLRKIFAERLPVNAVIPARAPVTWTDGSPFLGLAHYGVQHAPIFFGRTAAKDAVISQLRANAARRRAFVLILGGSGAGKSSLARAGVLSFLQKPGVIEGVDSWRLATLQPREGAGMENGLFRALVRALVHPGTLPELAAGGEFDEARLAGELREAPLGVTHLVRGGLLRAAGELRLDRRLDYDPKMRLALLVDQMEELFTQEWVTPAERESFVRALRALAQSGDAWVIGTMRSDFFHQCVALPELMELKEGEGQYHLKPPTEAEIGQMIRWPATAAGLSFEEDARTGERLDDRLRDDALGNPHTLPLLSFALHHLYEEGGAGTGQLSLAAYHRLGRLKGALCRQADGAYAAFSAGLSNPERDEAFDGVMRQLTADPTGEGKFARQWAPKANCERTPAQGRLVAAFIDARLFVTDGSSESAALSVAHEALMHEWDTLKGWLEKRREFFQSLARLNADLARWQEVRRAAPGGAIPRDVALDKTGSPAPADDYLLEGRRLAEAGGLLDEARGQLAAEQIEFIERSRARAEAGARRRRRRLQRAAAGFAALALLASGFAVFAWKAEREAQRQRQEVQRVLAASEFARGQELFDGGDAPGGLAYVAQAAEADPAGARPALERLWHALTQRSWPLALSAPIRHGGAVLTASLSPDGSQVITAGADGVTRLWQAATGQPAGRELRQPKAVRCAVFTADGQRVLTGCFDGSVRLWETSSGRPVPGWDADAHGDEVTSAAVSPRGHWAATGSRDGTVSVWDLATGQRAAELSHPENVHILEFCPANESLLLTVSGPTLRLWSAPGGKLLLEARHDGEIRSARFSPDGRRIVTAADDKQVRLWTVSPDGGSAAASGQIPHEAEVRDACFNAAGDILATVSGTQVRLWRPDGSRLVEEALAHRDAVTVARFSPDGQRLLTGCRDGRTQLWAARTGEPLGEPIRAGGAVLTTAFAPDGRRVLVATADGETRVWQAPSSFPACAVWPQGGAVPTLAVSADGHWLGAAAADGNACLWDLTQEPPVPRTLAHPAAVLALAFSADGRFLATGAADAQARLWTLAAPAQPAALLPHGAAVCAVAFSPDSRRLATATETGAAQCWSLPDLRPVGKAMVHAGRIAALSYSGDGRLLVTASADGTARVWYADTGEPASPPLPGEDGKELLCAAFNPTADIIAVGSRSGAVQWWDAATGKALREPSRHQGAVLALTFSRDGRRLLTASEDGAAVIWDAASGKPVSDALRHASAVTAAAFAPDGRHAATATEDGLTRLWDAESGQAVSEWLGGAHGQPVRALAFSADGHTLFSGADDHRARAWNLTVPPLPSPQSLIEFARVVAAVRWQESGRLEPLSAPTLETLRTLAQGGQPALDRRLPDWFFADPAQRKLTPGAGQTAAEYLAARLQEGTPAALDEAELLAAGDAKAAALIQRLRQEQR